MSLYDQFIGKRFLVYLRGLLIYISVYFLFSFSSAAFASKWKIENHRFDAEQYQRLQDRYPSIDSPLTLEALLNEIERISYNRRVEAYWEGDEIVIHLDPTKPIRTIDYRLVTREFRVAYDGIAQSFLGMAYSKEALDSLVKQIKAMLATRGFYLPKVELFVEEQEDYFKIEVKIDEGEPCLIRSIETEIYLPPRLKLGVKEGDICDYKILQKSVRELEEGLLDYGYKQVQLADPVLTYESENNTALVVIRGNLGRIVKYEIEEVGDKKFFIDDIFSGSGLSAIDPTIMSPEAVQSELARYYRNRGYVDVSIADPEISQIGRDEYRYLFRVTKGQQYRLSNVVLEGFTALSRDEALEILGVKTFWQGNKLLNLEELRTGIESLKAKYQTIGYWDINIGEPRVTKTRETGLAQIVVIANEGRERFLREIKYGPLDEEYYYQVLELQSLQEGKPLDRSDLIDLERKLRSYFIALGYLYVDVKLSLTSVNLGNRIALTLNVNVEPGVRVRVGTINVKGLVRTKEKVVKRELRFESGDWYSPEIIDRSRRALLALGLFQSVQIQQSDINALNDKTSVLDITVTVKESRPGNIRFGPGWSLLRGGRFGIESSYNNLGGVGRQVFLRGSLSEESHQDAIGPKTLVGRSFSIGLLEPYIFNLPLAGTISLSHLAFADDVWIFSDRGEIALSHKFRHFIPDSLIAFYYGQRINNSEGTRAQELARVATPQIRVGFVGVRYTWDNRDNVAWPTQGFFLETDNSWARYPFGGELQYFYWSTDVSMYKQIDRDVVFAFGVSFSSYNNIRNKDSSKDHVLPSAQLLHLEGTKAVRGFREKTLGPTVSYFSGAGAEGSLQGDNEPGGTHRSLIRNELRYQITEKTLAVTAFVDLGTVFFTEDELDRFRTSSSYIRDNDPFEFSDLLQHPEYLWTKQYASYGVSLNYLTPVGSLNLAYGLPWKRCAVASGDCEVRKGKTGDFWLLNGEFHINVGATF